MYDDRKSCEANPMSFVMEIQLKKEYVIIITIY